MVEELGDTSQTTTSKSQRIDCIYGEERLRFEKDPRDDVLKMQAQDPLEEVDLGDGSIKRITYINTKIKGQIKDQVIKLLKEFKDCFAWDYNEMSGLSREMVEMKLPINQENDQSSKFRVGNGALWASRSWLHDSYFCYHWSRHSS